MHSLSITLILKTLVQTYKVKTIKLDLCFERAITRFSLNCFKSIDILFYISLFYINIMLMLQHVTL